MMLLGIVLHAAVSYAMFNLGDLWPYRDRATSFVATGLVGLIHVLRMPVFFVMAGFLPPCSRGGAEDGSTVATGAAGSPFRPAWGIIRPETDQSGLGGSDRASAEL
jgi:hypothetical protein